MKKFIKKLFLFMIPALVYSVVAMIVMPDLLSLQNGPSTKEQITQSFEHALKKDYEILILGNSRTYRGLNPDFFTYKTYNFSHDHDSYNQIYYKLKFLLERKKHFDYVILGTDYFQFSFKSDTRNYAYSDFLGDDYLKDFSNSNAWMLKMSYHLGNINPKNLWSLEPKKEKPFIRENGQYINPQIASDTITIKREIKRLDFQVKYFRSILELCNSKNIKVFMVMMPTTVKELGSYTKKEMMEFDLFIASFTDNKRIFYLNYSKRDGFQRSDYTDMTHLNEDAANRFSKILDCDIIQLIEKEN